MVPVLDPRGPVPNPVGGRAPRPRDYVGKRLLLVDNGKLAPEFGPYGVLFETLRELLAEAYPGVQVVTLRRNLLEGSMEDLDGLAAGLISRLSPDGAILALSDTGVSQPTALLAVGLEKRGIPTCVLCLPLGAQLSRITTGRLLPGIPHVVIRSKPEDRPEDVREETRALFPLVVRALTEPRGAAEAASQGPERQSLPGDQGIDAADTSGLLPLDDEARRALAELGGDPGAWEDRLLELLCRHRIGDGLPVVTPTPSRVEAMLAAVPLRPDDVLIDRCLPAAVSLTVKLAAINAVMAGCTPELFPVVIAALRAMGHPDFRLFQAAVTTHPAGTMVLVSGPLAARLGIASGPGCLGPGFRANATIGRAINLVLLNVCRAVPGLSDLTRLGSPAEFTYCFAEAVDESPWPPLHAGLLGPNVTTVTVHKCEGPHNVLNNVGRTPEEILTSVASAAATLAGNNVYNPAELVVILNPEHARTIAAAGWSKDDVRHFLFEKARIPRESLRGHGITPIWPRWFYSMERIPVVRRPEDILVVVAGGPGPQSAVAIPWGYSRAVTVAIEAVSQ